MDLVTIFELKKNRKIVKTFFYSFLLVLISFGAKLFNQSYPSDDYFRIYFTENWYTQSDRGRWFASILNNLIFKEELFVLPYFNTILSLFFISLSGLLISKIWSIKNHLIIGITILLITVSPFWANNLFYSSNVSVSIGAFLSTVGVYFLIRKEKVILSLIILILSFGIYQTVFQSALIITLGTFLLKYTDVNSKFELKKILFKYFLFCFYIISAFVISQVISELIMKFNSVDVFYSPYNSATREFSLFKILKKSIYLFTSPKGFLGNFVFNNLYVALLVLVIFILGFIAQFKNIIDSDKPIKKHKLVLLIVSFVFLVIILQGPRILGILMPLRSSFHFSILLLFVLLSINYSHRNIKNVTIAITLLYVLMSVKYISVFYDVVNRQTQSDILIANQIVNRIRDLPNIEFVNEKASPFLILGTKKIPVTSSYLKFIQKNKLDLKNVNMGPAYFEFQAFNKDWSKYKIFEHFTDFNFRQLDNEKAIKIKDKIISHRDNFSIYPEKNSIKIIDNVVVLILSIE